MEDNQLKAEIQKVSLESIPAIYLWCLGFEKY